MKQRLLGVVVLLGLLVLLAPALFRGGDNHPLVKVEITAELKKPPEVPEFVQILEVAPEPVEVDPADQPEAYDNSPPGNDQEGHLKAWTLQLASFFDEKNARKLEERLKQDGYSAYTQRLRSKSGGGLYKVFVGPEARADDLLKVKSDLDGKYEVSSLLVRFSP